jgi:hypothetical protein
MEKQHVPNLALMDTLTGTLAKAFVVASGNQSIGSATTGSPL